MSEAEMKLKAISYLINLKKEESIKQILEQLEKLNRDEKVLNLSQHYPAIKRQYDNVLKRLSD